MKTLLKLIVAAAVINAAYRVGMDEYQFSKLKDSTHSLLVLGTQTPLEELKEKILMKAEDLMLPLSPERVRLTRENLRTTVSFSYSSEPEVFPGYKHKREHSFTDEITAIR